MKANERLSKVVRHTGESRASLARRADLIPQRLTDIINEKTKDISFDVADKLANAVPNLNREWLLTGEGDMLIGDTSITNNGTSQQVAQNVRGHVTQSVTSDLTSTITELTDIIKQSQELVSTSQEIAITAQRQLNSTLSQLAESQSQITTLIDLINRQHDK